jgi:hypothetical protein
METEQFEEIILPDFEYLYRSLYRSGINPNNIVEDDDVPDELCIITEWTEGDTKYRYRFWKDPRLSEK